MDFFVNFSVDIVLVILFFTNVFDFARKGFVKCILSIVCMLVAIFLATQFAMPLAEAVYDSFVEEKIVEYMQGQINNLGDINGADFDVQYLSQLVPEYSFEYLKKLGIDVDKIIQGINGADFSSQDAAEIIVGKVLSPFVLVLLKLVCYVLIFYIVRFVLGCIIGLIDKIASLPLLNRVNKWLGAALGVVKGVIVTVMLCLLINTAAVIINDGSNLDKALDSSRICAAVAEFGINSMNFLN